MVRPLKDSLEFTLMRANAHGTYSKTDKFQLGSKELTLRRLRVEAFGSQNREDLVPGKQMLLHGFRMGSHVIQRDRDKRTTAVKIHVHCSIVRRRCIAQAKMHHLKLVRSKSRLKCRAIHTFVENPNLIKLY